MTAPWARVAVTREGDGADRLARALADRGLTPVITPLIARVPPIDGGRALRSALAGADAADWIVVTSPNGADAVIEAAPSRTGGARIAAVGPTTAERLEDAGRSVALVPDRFDAESLAATLIESTDPGRAIVAVSALADDTVEAALTRVGWLVDRVEAYRIVPRPPAPDEIAELVACDLITLASGSAATVLAELDVARPVVCMGRVTADRATELGLDVRGIADPSNLAGLVAATVMALDHTDDRHEETNEQ